jgi:hypothetical protein
MQVVNFHGVKMAQKELINLPNQPWQSKPHASHKEGSCATGCIINGS